MNANINRTKSVLALDVGGSSVKCGLVQSGNINNLKTIPINSNGNKEAVIEAFSKIIQDYLDFNVVAGLAFSIPGPFDYEKGVSYIEASQNKFGALYGVNLKESLQMNLALDIPISFRNDGESAIVGEAIYGAGKVYKRLVGITLGTGFGSAFIINGKPHFEGEGIPKKLPLYDCIWKNQRVDDIFSIRGLMSRLASLGFYDNPKKAVNEAKHNSQIRNVLDAWGDDLGQFLNASISSFKAEALIVQGGLSGGMEYFAKSLQRNLSARVVKHSLGSKAALLGASDAFNEQYGSI